MKKVKREEEVVLQEPQAPKKEEMLRANKVENKPKAIREDESLREENRKVFETSDGTLQAVFYPEAVHFYDKKKKHFIEVDNSVEDEEDGKYIRNKKNNKFVTRFNKETNSDELFVIESEGFAIKISTVEHHKRKIKKKQPKVHKGESKSVDRIIFNDVESSTNFEYTVHSDRVKEDIVIKSKKASYKYGFVIEHIGLSLDESENANELTFCNGKKEIFSIPTPFMYDANDVLSTNVMYEIEAIEEGKSKLTVIADEAWINDESRAFPVVIDPQIIISGTTNTSTFSLVGTTMVSYNSHLIGNTSVNGAINRMFIKLNVPNIAGNPRIQKVELTLNQYDGYIPSSEVHRLGVYEVVDAVSVGECQSPSFDDVPIDYVRAKNGSASYTFDITKALDDYYNGVIASPTVMVKMIDETVDSTHYVRMYGSSNSTEGPIITVTYDNSYAMPSSSAHTHEIGRFGAASVDLITGALNIESEDFVWKGIRKPVSIKHFYNNALGNRKYTKNASIRLNVADFGGMSLGYGWRLNYMQSMVECTFMIEGESITGFIYTDETGNEMFFKKSGVVDGCTMYADTDGLGYEYCSDSRKLTIGEEFYLFDDAGRLVTITDGKKPETKIQITYDGTGKITKITDGIGRSFIFVYTSNSTYGNYLSAIKAPDESIIKYEYSSGKLISVTYPNGQVATITNATAGITAVTLKDSNSVNLYKIAYTYMNKYGTSNYCVYQVREYGYTGSDWMLGKYATYSSSTSARKTTVYVYHSGNVSENKSLVYTFNEKGIVVGNYKNQGTKNSKIAFEGIASGIDPLMNGKIESVSNVDNLLLNHSFEEYSDGTFPHWNCMSGNSSKFEMEQDSAYSNFGKYSIYIDSQSSSALANGIYQTVSALPIGKYAFSAYVKLYGSKSSRDGIYLRVRNSVGTVIAESEHIRHYTTKFERIVLPFEISTGSTLNFEILIDGYLDAYIDAVQLERNEVANEYNLLENSNFEVSLSNGWENHSSGVYVSSAEKFNMSKSMAVTGSLDVERYAKQEVVLNSGFGVRDTYVLSGWAKAPCIEKKLRDGENLPKFRLKAVVNYENYEDNISGNVFYADFSPYTDEWQMATVKFCKSKYGKVKSIDVYCEYGYSVGIAYFDNIQLIRKKLETGLNSEDFEVKADDSTIIDELESKLHKEIKDGYGNELTKTLLSGGEIGTIYESIEYSLKSENSVNDDGGNNIASKIDQRGNRTLFDMNTITSRCEVVTDRLGNKLKYSYDNDGRVNGISIETTDGVEKANVEFEYNPINNSLLKATRSDGQAYVFNYTNFQRIKNIGIENKTDKLLSYEYNSGNGRINRISYANGDYSTFTYNTEGKVLNEKWYNSSNIIVAEYEYLYDSSENIVKSIDKTNQIEYNYIYENGKISIISEIDISGEIKVERCSIEYFYDNRGKLSAKQIRYDDNNVLTNNFKFSKLKDQSVEISYGTHRLISNSKSDKLYRKICDELNLGEGFVSRQFVYHYGKFTNQENIHSSPTTTLVSQIIMSDGRTISYEYDEEERISKISDSKGSTVSYLYDEIGQLVKETRDGIVKEFVYDNHGNILSKDGKTYVYGNSAWKDLLTQVGNDVIEYDKQGNPTLYLGNSLVWEKGRKLKSFGDNSYTYNANGIRITKTVNNVCHKYLVAGSAILREIWDNNTLVPLYDNEECVCGIIFNSTPYYFLRNLHNDVIAITDNVGNVVAEYDYDAWGACTIKQDTTQVKIATINPFRYRSYYYDSETELYYLNFRYYDPKVGRFISADDIEYSLQQDKCAINLYSYCGNNPVNNTDESGHLEKLKNWFNKKKEQVKEIGRKITNFVEDVSEDVEQFVDDAIECVKETTEKVFDEVKTKTDQVLGQLGIKDEVDKVVEFVEPVVQGAFAIGDTLYTVGRFLGETVEKGSAVFLKEFFGSLANIRNNISNLDFEGAWDELAQTPSNIFNGLKEEVWKNFILKSHNYLNRIIRNHYMLDCTLITKERSNQNLMNNIQKVKGKAWENFGIIYSQHEPQDEYSAYDLEAGYGLKLEAMGCELIAVYNACVGVDKPMPLPAIIYWFEQNNGLMATGAFGTNPYKFKDFFDICGIQNKRYDDLTTLTAEWDGYGTYILTVWGNNEDVTGMIHTYAVFSNEYKLIPYNHKNFSYNEELKKFNTFEEVIGAGDFICGYKIG